MKDFSSVEKLLKESGRAGQIMDAVSPEDAQRLENMVDFRHYGQKIDGIREVSKRE